MKTIDYTLYLIADSGVVSPAKLPKAVAEAAAGGVTLVQLRAKSLPDSEFIALARQVKAVTDAYNLPLIINDRLDAALEIEAAGLHIGQSDLPAAKARERLGSGRILGVSAADAEEARLAALQGADYLGVGAMFPTATKRDARLVSLDELIRIRQAVSLPIVVIGGVDQKNAALFGPLGAAGAAVSSAILTAPDRTKAAAVLKGQFLKGIMPQLSD